MKIQNSGIVTAVIKNPETQQWHVTVKSGRYPKTYIGFKIKPKVKEGDRVEAGEEL